MTGYLPLLMMSEAPLHKTDRSIQALVRGVRT
jgi:hypothetical protein